MLGFFALRRAVVQPSRCLHAAAAAMKDIRIVLPQMSESVIEGVVVAIPKPVGSAVAVDEIVMELDTDKVKFEVRSADAGVVKSIAVTQGQTVPVGALLLIIDSEGSASVSATRSAPAAAAPSPATTAPVEIPLVVASSGSRVPAIQFRHGSRAPVAANQAASHLTAKSASHAAKLAGSAAKHAFADGSYTSFLDSLMPSKATSSYLDVAPAFGRPPMSQREIAAIESGGATAL